MIVHPAAYALLLISFQPHPAYGKIPTNISKKDQHEASDVSSKIRPTRQLRLNRSSDEGNDTAASVDVGRGKASKTSKGGRVGNGNKRDDAAGNVGVDEVDGSDQGDTTSGLVDSLGDQESKEEPPTIWPTYVPSPFVSDASYIVTPTIVTHSNCAPIGSRPRPSGPPKNTPNPTPKITDTLMPSKDDKSSPVTFRRGNLQKDVPKFGFKVTEGMAVRPLAKAGFTLALGNGQKSELRFHSSPDGAAIIPLNDGYVYVSNSEMRQGEGGVYGIYFDHDGNVMDYKMLLSGTTRNCSGGTTPWGTFVSCEEYGNGQCWQVDPDPLSKHHPKPEKTKLGGDGGNFEAVACDDRNLEQPIFFVTEDLKSGALRRYTPPMTIPGTAAGWDALHAEGGTTEFLVFLEDNSFVWSCDEWLGRYSQEKYFPNVEGIVFREGLLYFVSKRTSKLYVLDLDNGTYTASSTKDYSLYSGEFKNRPDQLATNDGEFLYFTEEGGQTPGVYAIDAEGQSYAIFEAYDSKYFNDETTGLAFSPDGTKMYACFQDCGCEVSGDIDCGCLFVFWRTDGRSFDGATLGLKFH
mmetsp:Transcript_20038/g.37717  ORF Transcript_20038/g.37717 Transcript_20038/m.37717 type:complete len:576 (+) Transcript_20038:247-1974(+)